MRREMSKKQAAQGFTLIELMIVIAIIAILAAVAIPNFMQARDRARRTGCIQNLGTWRKVMEMYANDNDLSSYPTEVQSTTKLYAGGTYASHDKAVDAYSQYTNVTTTLNGCFATTFGIVGSAVYSIDANANDRNRTPITATADTVEQP